MNFELEPYLPRFGNKFGIMDQLYGTLRLLDIPQPRVIYSPFCGGGAFEYFLARQGFKVLASDVDSGLIKLHNLCRTNPKEIQAFGKESFTKSAFKKAIEGDSARAAYVRSIWSFSNNGKHYLTAETNEKNKIEEFERGVAEPNSRHVHVEDICLLWHRRPNLDISFACQSYEAVTVAEGELAYCDIPYKNTAKYQKDGFDHDKFYEWALSQKGLVLISEYNMPDDFVLIAEYPKWVEYGRGARNKMAIERLYANKPVKKLVLF